MHFWHIWAAATIEMSAGSPNLFSTSLHSFRSKPPLPMMLVSFHTSASLIVCGALFKMRRSTGGMLRQLPSKSKSLPSSIDRGTSSRVDPACTTDRRFPRTSNRSFPFSNQQQGTKYSRFMPGRCWEEDYPSILLKAHDPRQACRISCNVYLTFRFIYIQNIFYQEHYKINMKSQHETSWNDGLNHTVSSCWGPNFQYFQSHTFQKLMPFTLFPFSAAESHHTEIKHGSECRWVEIWKDVVDDQHTRMAFLHRRYIAQKDLSSLGIRPVMKDVSENVQMCSYIMGRFSDTAGECSMGEKG